MKLHWADSLSNFILIIGLATIGTVIQPLHIYVVFFCFFFVFSFFEEFTVSAIIGLKIFYFLNKYDNISAHCILQITGSEWKQEYLYSSSPLLKMDRKIMSLSIHFQVPRLLLEEGR